MSISKLISSFKNEGIAKWEISNTNIIEARNKILMEPHTRISELITRDIIFSDFLKDPILKELLENIYNENFHLTTYSSNTLRKNDNNNNIDMHVDYPYHDIKFNYPDKILGVQVIFALDDFTVENGATYYIPNSFISKKPPSLNDAIKFNLLNIKRMIVSRGTIILYRGDLWHSGGINKTDSPRVAILANFSPLYINAKDNIYEQVINCPFEIDNIMIKENKIYLK